MKILRKDRWILSNQLKILSKLDLEGREDYEKCQKIIENGYEYLYSDCIKLIIPDDQTITEKESELAINILEMFRSITLSLKKIGDKTGIKLDQLNFYGFDSIHEGKYYGFVKFFCTEFDVEKFPEIGKDVNNFKSNYPALDAYRRMLKVWKACKDKYELTKEELIKIGNASIHPDKR